MLFFLKLSYANEIIIEYNGKKYIFTLSTNVENKFEPNVTNIKNDINKTA